MINFFERVQRGVKGVKGFFIFGEDGNLIDSYAEPSFGEETATSLSVFLGSIRALKEFEWLIVDGERGKIIVYRMGDLKLGFYCEATCNPVLLDVAVRKKLARLQQEIYDELNKETEKLKDALKEVAHQHMGSAGDALIEQEFSHLISENAAHAFDQMEKAASLLIGPTRASAMREELETIKGGMSHD